MTGGANIRLHFASSAGAILLSLKASHVHQLWLTPHALSYCGPQHKLQLSISSCPIWPCAMMQYPSSVGLTAGGDVG